MLTYVIILYFIIALFTSIINLYTRAIDNTDIINHYTYFTILKDIILFPIILYYLIIDLNK